MVGFLFQAKIFISLFPILISFLLKRNKFSKAAGILSSKGLESVQVEQNIRFFLLKYSKKCNEKTGVELLQLLGYQSHCPTLKNNQSTCRVF